jgi:hypothetical protein
MQTILIRVETSNFEFQESVQLILAYLHVPDLNGYLCSEQCAQSAITYTKCFLSCR